MPKGIKETFPSIQEIQERINAPEDKEDVKKRGLSLQQWIDLNQMMTEAGKNEQ